MPSQSIAERVDPGLNPYQPNQSNTAPIAAMFKSCAGSGPPPSRTNVRPIRGPSASAPNSAIVAPTVCTAVEPAKSRNTTPSGTRLLNQPIVLPSQPPGPQIQWHVIG